MQLVTAYPIGLACPCGTTPLAATWAAAGVYQGMPPGSSRLSVLHHPLRLRPPRLAQMFARSLPLRTGLFLVVFIFLLPPTALPRGHRICSLQLSSLPRLTVVLHAWPRTPIPLPRLRLAHATKEHIFFVKLILLVEVGSHSQSTPCCLQVQPVDILHVRIQG